MPNTTTDAQTPPPGEHSDSLLRLIADSVPALMAYFDLPDLRCRFANINYARNFGLTPAEAVGKTVREIETLLDEHDAQVVGMVQAELRVHAPDPSRVVRADDILVIEA